VVGGGPAGATAARQLALRGRRVALFEKDRFPRFHVGESFLPRTMMLLRKHGLGERVLALPQVEKRGAQFVIGDGSARNDYWFKTALVHETEDDTFNVERSLFDRELLEAAREAGVEVHEGAPIEGIERLADGDVALRAGGAPYTGRVLIDASGLFTHLGRHFELRRVHPKLKNVAYYGHFRNVERRPGIEGGFATIVMCEEGWFWLIPLNDEVTSIGLVMEERHARNSGIPPKERLQWGIRSCPVVAERCRHAQHPEHTYITADYSHSCRPYAGPGFFLVGDAATFIDPIFSTGVTLGMMTGERAAVLIDGMLDGNLTARRARRLYGRYIRGSTRPYFRIVESYYDHSFREVFLQGQGPFELHRAVIAVLAGHTFPRPVFAVRWRLALFHLLVALQRCGVPLVPRQSRFSLLASPEPSRPATALGG
jgi:flavin-dependent dehydrogenase